MSAFKFVSEIAPLALGVVSLLMPGPIGEVAHCVALAAEGAKVATISAAAVGNMFLITKQTMAERTGAKAKPENAVKPPNEEKPAGEAKTTDQAKLAATEIAPGLPVGLQGQQNKSKLAFSAPV